MRIDPNWLTDDRSTCEWTDCDRARWAPYSWEHCPYHFAVKAFDSDQERKSKDLPPIAVTWARSRFCGVLNGYTPELGDVAWDTHFPREELAEIAGDLGLQLNADKETQWRIARGRAAARYSKIWENARRTPPGDYEGPGTRRAISRENARFIISTDYTGGGGLSSS